MGTSFYGGGCIIVNGGGGSLNYNDLMNTPIKNLSGTSLQPIIFSKLDFGNYIITGYRQHNEDDIVYIESTPTYVQIFEDDITLKKIVKLESFENNEYQIVALIYEEDESYISKKFSFSSVSDKVEIPEEVLTKIKEEILMEANNYTNAMMTLNIF